MGKVLLVDTNVSSAPIYDFLCSEGHEVYVTGNNPNDFLAKCAKKYIQADYSDIRSLEEIIEQLKIDFLVPGCNDASYKACSLTNKNHRFPGIDCPVNTETLNNKKLYREFAKENSLPVPRYFLTEESIDIDSPFIVKPADSFSGRGTTVILKNNQKELEEAIRKAKKYSPSGMFLIEEFVSGQLYSHSAFIEDQKTILDIIVEEHCVANPFAVDTSRVCDGFPEQARQLLHQAVEKTAQTLKLKDGLIHTQFILRPDYSIRLIEPTRRCPGDLYSKLIDLSTDIHYAENYTRPFLGLQHHFPCTPDIKEKIVRHTITDKFGGNFWTLSFTEPVKLREYIPLSLCGDVINPAPQGRIGIMFLTADTQKEFDNIFRKAIERKIYNCTRP